MIVQHVIMGALFGDEGKGKTVQYVCKEPDPKVNQIVVRYDGGHQVGHTAVLNDITHEFHHFGSGTLKGVPTFWSKNCTIYPELFMDELAELRSLGIEPVIFFHKNCPITTDYDIDRNLQHQKFNRHGTTGLGFGQTIQREEDFYHLHLEDLFFGPEILEQKLHSIFKKYYGGKSPETRYIDEVYGPFTKLFDSDSINMVDDRALDKYDTIVFEGSQGLLLDKHSGFFPNVTRAHTNEITAMPLMKKKAWLELHYVLRAYLTRHGDGPLINEDVQNTIIVDPRESNQHNENQGEFRRTYLSLPYLKYALSKNRVLIDSSKVDRINFYINCVDHLEEYALYDDDNELLIFDTKTEFLSHITNYIADIYPGIEYKLNFFESDTPESKYAEILVKVT